ncbi:MAG: tRNA (guanosine(46)-N7)-methyltransferase TrmB [Treponema sp.]|nr:tRNA (guanosine(46)-N7)-methyltransferase TrmB [Treponema sp.]
MILKSYVKRTGHFTDAQKKAYDSLSSFFLIPFSENNLDLKEIFANGNESSPVQFDITAEIGFGSGFTAAEIAQANPDKKYIGIEVHRPGIGKLLWEIEKRKLSNIRIIEHDAVFVFEKMIPKESLCGIHIFFPDPWPKKRHRKRRLVTRPFTQYLCGCLKKGGYFYMVTDWEDYALHALGELESTEGLKNAYNDFAPVQEWRPRTGFERKGLEKGHIIRELFFNKI